ncbi:MAG: hypothetical protein HYZ51_04275 [Candidatus Doudnabacteria bacterium]|nr:hypothetical protein [Candidatus Doudnabacteria bacterium]
MQTIIMHLDMNSYFASVIQQDNPEYRGKPLGVCEHLGGIIIGASKEAKKWGITTGTPVWEARKLYPKIILAHTTAERFRFYTRRLVKLVSEYTSKVEVYSIDEVFLDLTRACNIRCKNEDVRYKNQILNPIPYILNNMVDPFEEAVNITLDIKRRMKREVGDWFTCSVGIAENKVLAKIGSDLKKPDGIAVIQNSKSEYRSPKQILKSRSQILNLQKAELYHRLVLTDVPGIGPRQERNLNQLGIRTLLDLKNYPQSHLMRRFGRIMGHHLHNLGQLNSSWKAGVHQDSNIKSIGHMYTLPKEFREQKFFIPVLYKLCEMVGRRLRRKGLEGNILHFFVWDQNYKGFGHSEKLGDHVFDGREIFTHAKRLFERVKPKNDWGFKLIGVTVANVREQNGQLSLFYNRERQRCLAAALDRVNDKYGEFTITRAPVLAAGKVFRDSVGFGRVKEL